MEAKGSYVLVGAFVLLVGVAMVASLFWLAGWGNRSDETYLVLMEESVSGLELDAPVKYRGVNVGRVASMDIRPDDPETVQLTLSVHPDTPILQETRAQLEFQGLTGLAFINLLGGTRGSAPLEPAPGARYPVIATAPSILVRLDNGVSDLLVSVTATSDRVHDLLGEVDHEQLARTLRNLDRLSAALADSTDGLGPAVANASRFLDHAADAGESLPRLVTRMDSLAAAWAEAGEEVTLLTADSRRDLRRMSGEVTGSVQMLSADLGQLVDRLEQLVLELEEDPTMFIYGRPEAAKGPGE